MVIMQETHSDQTFISANQVAKELHLLGASDLNVHEITSTLGYLASIGIIPVGKVMYNSSERGLSKHYPQIVVKMLKQLNDLQKRGIGKDRAISMLLHQEIEQSPGSRLSKIRRDERPVGGAEALNQTRMNTRATLSLKNSKVTLFLFTLLLLFITSVYIRFLSSIEVGQSQNPRELLIRALPF